MTNTKRKLVSVIMSTFNNKGTIENCINSIKKQSYSPLEIIVVDEWSKDGTDKIARKLGAKVYSFGKERANNRNYGIKKAKGDYYFILDSDMELTKNVITSCIKKLKEGYGAIVLPENSEGSGYWAAVRGYERQFVRNDDSIEAARFFKKDVLDKVGYYDPGIVGAEDWDLHQRLLQKGYKVGRVKDIIIHHEGKLELSRLLKKKAYYGKAFLLYKSRYPVAFKKSVMRTSLLRNLHRLFIVPKYGIGVLFLKFLEGMSLFYGMYAASKGKAIKHY